MNSIQNICDISSAQWHKYFQENARNLQTIPWESKYQLSDDEKERVIASIQQFELGENAEGKTFKQKALVYAQKHDSAYMDALDLFIKEEQRHSATLRRFLQTSAQPTLKRHWVDSIFRKLRKLMDIEVEIIVLLTAETIAMVYYSRLKAATKSPVLIAICKQISLDETRHLNFQSSSLYKIRQTHSYLRKFVMTNAHLFLLLGTTIVVWWQHNSVLSYCKKSYFQFLREVLLVFYKTQLVSWGKI